MPSIRRDREAEPINKVYPLRDIEKPTAPEPVTGGWSEGRPIVVDLGTHQTRVGYASGAPEEPDHVFYTQVSKFRDRKVARTYQLVGNEAYVDQAGKSNIRSPFDGSMIQNWDMIETVLDYSFAKISVQSQGSVDNPVVMSEMLGCPMAQRKTMNEMLFELYGVPATCFGVDSMFSYRYNKMGSNGLIISAGNDTIDLIPMSNGKGVVSLAKRINWGGRYASAYLQSLLSLKYPVFPTKITGTQAMLLMQDHCYVSKDYDEEIAHYLDWDGLADRERVVEAPYTPTVVVEKSAEELARIAEKRKESGRRLQEQAAKVRLEKLLEKENDIQYYRNLQERVESANKKDKKRLLDADSFRDEQALQKKISELDRAIRRARKQDIGDDDMDEEPPSFPLIDVLDEDLDEDSIKEKRRQKLMKANYDARMRAKEEKEAEKKRLEEEEKQDAEWRERDKEGWLEDRRSKLMEIFNRRRERQQLKEDLSNRKSHAAQMRMKSIAALATESSRGSKRRRRGQGEDDADDTFGANDEDWMVYRDITKEVDSEAEEDEQRLVEKLHQQLNEHDPEFRIDEYAREAGAIDWRDSVINMFLRGPREFDHESQAQAHQIHLNVERIRVPEVMFQPSIAGIDQAGIMEIADDIILRRFPGGITQHSDLTQNIFLTGGLANFEDFDARVHRELRALLPVGTPIKVTRAMSPSADAWKGMSQWATTDEFRHKMVTRQEYEEYGSEYIKEHGYGNSFI
ncbi:actin-related protein 5 [Trichomonascus vanleenenianus]|uniref:actin-related protein ARP5 n=1 Tax=Trichomonascus vanleenenianus TaxID=2268995 RepID=UPI003ECA5729